MSQVIKTIAKILFFVTGFGKFQIFTPDLFLEEGQNLSEYGWGATVILLPGHSKGSIGVLAPDDASRQFPSAASGQVLFCGDLLENTKKPAVNALGDNRDQMKASAEKLKGLSINTVYPGHGMTFLLNQIWSE
jgi:hydroxyacylglutathione hydrolase